MKQIILASSSPRRKQILEKARLPFVVQKSFYKERIVSAPPSVLAEKLAAGKALKVARKNKNSIVIAADTFVVFKDKILGKPKNAKNAKGMLKMLQGKTHMVITGVCVLDSDTMQSRVFSEVARIYLKPLSDLQIDSYLARNEWQDKAGGYGMQDLAAVFVERVEGDFLGALGLPLARLCEVLREFGIEVL